MGTDAIDRFAEAARELWRDQSFDAPRPLDVDPECDEEVSAWAREHGLTVG